MMQSTVENERGIAPLEDVEVENTSRNAEGWRVILYDDDWHGYDEVVDQLQKATACDRRTATRIMLEVDKRGRGVCFRGGLDECQRVVQILREIRLQCEVDDD